MAALLLAALNPRPTLALRLLIWTTPPLPIGLWIGLGASGGALLSASAAALALQQQGAPSQRLSGRRRPESAVDNTPEPWSEPWQQQPSASRMANWFTRQPGNGSPAAPEAAPPRDGRRSHSGGAGPERAPGEPAPTVAVPFRVLHRPGARSTAAAAAAGAWTEPSAAVNREPPHEAVAVADDWGQSEEDDW